MPAGKMWRLHMSTQTGSCAITIQNTNGCAPLSVARSLLRSLANYFGLFGFPLLVCSSVKRKQLKVVPQLNIVTNSHPRGYLSL